MRRVLISIKPQFVDMIFRSDKTVELRKKIPALSKGDEIFVYASTPVKALVGVVEVKEVLQSSPDSLWKLVKDRAGINHDFFADYYKNCDTAYGIVLGRTLLFEEPIGLPDMREAWPGFVPPQNYRYVELMAPSRAHIFSAVQEPILLTADQENRCLIHY